MSSVTFDEFVDKHRLLIIAGIVLFAFILRCWPVFLMGDLSRDEWRGDTAQYEGLADSMLQGKGCAVLPTTFEKRFVSTLPALIGPTSIRAPGFPFFLAVMFFIFGHSMMAVRIAQCVLGASTVLFIYFIGAEMINRRTGIIAAAIACVYPAFIVWHLYGASHVHVETLFIFVLVLLLLVTYRTAKNPTFSNSVITGLLLALAMYVREAATALPVFVFAGLIFAKYNPLKKRMISFFVILITLVACITPWIVRNYRVHNALVWSTFGGEIFWQSNNPASRGGWDLPLEVDEYIKEVKGLSEMEINRLRFKQGLHYLKNNKGVIPKLFLRKLLMLWNVYDEDYRISYGIIFILFVWGAVLMAKTPAKRNEFLFLSIYILYFSILAVIFHGKPRYRLPLEPNLILLASMAINYIVANWHILRNRIALYAIIGTNIFLGINSQKVLTFLREVFELLRLR